jgi:alpha-tubulin suppressor-like RCC1 family protein/photosystem II stability/assembly factor-like uncharacterized protein
MIFIFRRIGTMKVLRRKLSYILSVLMIVNFLTVIFPVNKVRVFANEVTNTIIEQPIAGGNGFSLALASGGSIFGSGKNQFGQLGGGTTTSPIPNFSDIRAIAAGIDHAIALKSDGTVWGWGKNGSGQVGDNSTVTRTSPVLVSGLTDIIAIAANGDHSLALKADGTLWAWGKNDKGQLGNGTTTNSNIPIRVLNISDVNAIAAGSQHSLAVKRDGTVWAWGSNGAGRLGDGTTTDSSLPVQVSGLSNVATITGGKEHSVALKADGTVWTWGHNSNGKLGDGTTTNRTIPVAAIGLSQVIKVASWGDHSLAIKGDGTVWAWGNNGNGRLGDNTTTSRSTPVPVLNLSSAVEIAAGNDHSLAATADGRVWAWGNNGDGRLGDGTTTGRLTPVPTNFTVATMSSNANLANLWISVGALNPAFNSNVTTYTLNVENDITAAEITAVQADNRASIRINGTVANSGTAYTVDLHAGGNPVTVEVTAEDGVTKRTYTVTVIRAASEDKTPQEPVVEDPKEPAEPIIEVPDTTKPLDQWQEIDNQYLHSTHILTFDNKHILVNKNSGQSTIKVLDNAGVWTSKLSGIAEVRSISQVPGTEIIYVLGSKEGTRSFYISRDLGETWSNLITEGRTFPGDIGTNNLEAILAENENVLYMAVANRGIYKTVDGGRTWAINNGNLSNAARIRNLWSIEGVLYAGLKEKGGIHQSKDGGITWTAVNNLNGLSDGGKEPRDLIIEGSTILMASKDGVWTTNLENPQTPWTRIPGTPSGKEVVKLIRVDGKLYSAVKDGTNSNLYHLEAGSFKAFTYNLAPGSVIDEFSDMSFKDGYFFVAHKKGLLKVDIRYEAFVPVQAPVSTSPVFEWTEINNDNLHSTHTLFSGNRLILVNKASSTSNVKVLGSDGLWKTTLSGIPEVKAVAEVPGKEIIYLAAARNYYISRDGGETWKRAVEDGLSVPDNGSNNIEAIWIENENTLYMVVNNRGIYKTIDGGRTWTVNNGNLNNAGKVRNVWFISGNLYAGLKDKGGIHQSKDGGLTWSSINGLSGLTDNGREPRDILVQGSAIFMGTKDGVWRTDLNNSSAAWIRIPGTTVNKEVTKLLLINNVLYCIVKDGTSSNIYYYEEDSFKPFGNKPAGTTVSDFFDMTYREGYFYAAHKSGLLKIAQDWDVNLWSHISGSTINEEVRGIAVVNNGSRYIAGTKSGKIYVLDKETRLSKGWELKDNAASEIRFIGLASNSDTVYVMGRNLLFVSEDGGETWERSANRLPDAAAQFEAAHLISRDEMYIVLADRGVYYTNNGGENWILRNEGLPATYNTDKKEWQVKAKAIHQHGQRLYLGMGQKQGVFVSVNGGQTWESVKGQQGLTENGREIRAFYTEANMVYIGTKDGVWRTNDGMNQWEKIPGDIPRDHDVISIMRRGNSLFAVAKKDGKVEIYETKDGNLNFKPMGTRPAGFTISDAYVTDRDGDFIVIGTKTGVVRIKLVGQQAASTPEVPNPIEDTNPPERPIVEDVPIPEDYNLGEYDIYLGFELIEDVSDLVYEEAEVVNNEADVIDRISNPFVKTVTVEFNETRTVNADIFKELQGKEKTLVFVEKDEEGTELYSWTFNGSSIETIIENLNLTINFGSAEEQQIRELAKTDDIFFISFENHGKLPGDALIRIKVEADWLRDKSLYLYYYNTETQALEKRHEGLWVDEEGYVEFTLKRNSDYILVDQELSAPGEDGEAPNPVDNGGTNPQDGQVQNPGDNTGTNPQDGEVPNPVDNGGTNPQDGEVPDPSDNGGTNPQDGEVLNPGDNTGTNPQDGEVPNPADNTGTNPQDGEVPNPVDNGGTNPQDGQVQNPGDNTGTNPQDGEVPDPSDNGGTNPQDGQVQNPGDNTGTNPQDGEVPNPVDNGETNPQDGQVQNPGDNTGTNPQDGDVPNPVDNGGTKPQDDQVQNPGGNTGTNPQDGTVQDPGDNTGETPQQQQPGDSLVKTGSSIDFQVLFLIGLILIGLGLVITGSRKRTSTIK